MGTDRTLTFGKTGPYLTTGASMDRDRVRKRLGAGGSFGGRGEETTEGYWFGSRSPLSYTPILKAAGGTAHMQPVDQFQLMEQMNPNKQRYCCSSKSVRWAEGIKSNV